MLISMFNELVAGLSGSKTCALSTHHNVIAYIGEPTERGEECLSAERLISTKLQRFLV